MLNRIILMGRLTADPELRQTSGGTSVATFSLAVERNYQSKDTNERQADFINCVAWRQTGEFISRYFSKGRMIAVEGSLQSRKYEDKTGVRRTAYEVVVDQAYFAGDKQKPDQVPAQTQANPAGDIMNRYQQEQKTTLPQTFVYNSPPPSQYYQESFLDVEGDDLPY